MGTHTFFLVILIEIFILKTNCIKWYYPAEEDGSGRPAAVRV
jgi:hypothetical protein